MAKTQTLTIPGGTVSLNEYINAERTNRFKAAKIKQQETKYVQLLCLKDKLVKMNKIDEATFVFYHKNRKKDYDNAEFYQKFIWDGIVEAGIIPNDTQRYTPATKHFYHKLSDADRIVVTLVENEDDKISSN